MHIQEPEPAAEAAAGSCIADRLTRLEEQVAALQNETAGLKQQLADFRKQFE
jgi:hypothetical protein